MDMFRFDNQRLYKLVNDIILEEIRVGSKYKSHYSITYECTKDNVELIIDDFMTINKTQKYRGESLKALICISFMNILKNNHIYVTLELMSDIISIKKSIIMNMKKEYDDIFPERAKINYDVIDYFVYAMERLKIEYYVCEEDRTKAQTIYNGFHKILINKTRSEVLAVVCVYIVFYHIDEVGKLYKDNNNTEKEEFKRFAFKVINTDAIHFKKIFSYVYDTLSSAQTLN